MNSERTPKLIGQINISGDPIFDVIVRPEGTIRVQNVSETYIDGELSTEDYDYLDFDPTLIELLIDLLRDAKAEADRI